MLREKQMVAGCANHPRPSSTAPFPHLFLIRCVHNQHVALGHQFALVVLSFEDDGRPYFCALLCNNNSSSLLDVVTVCPLMMTHPRQPVRQSGLPRGSSLKSGRKLAHNTVKERITTNSDTQHQTANRTMTTVSTTIS